MNTINRHPDTELLDRLRSGLLDAAPEQKTQLEAHLASCESCRRRADWKAQLRPDLLASPDLDNRLDQARRHALQMPRRSSLPRFAIPLAAAAAMALLAVLLVEPVQQQLAPPEPQLASSGTREVPELYEELDFYLWLADHKANTRDSAT